MRKIEAMCGAMPLSAPNHEGVAFGVYLRPEDKGVFIYSKVSIARKGINAWPEFASGFGLDPDGVVPGLSPDRYQVRIGLLYRSSDGSIGSLGDGREFALAPGLIATFFIPIPFMGIQYFADAPPEDTFLVVDGQGESHELLSGKVQPALREALDRKPERAMDVPVSLELIVPHRHPPKSIEGTVGKLNEKPIRGMPNS